MCEPRIEKHTHTRESTNNDTCGNIVDSCKPCIKLTVENQTIHYMYMPLIHPIHLV